MSASKTRSHRKSASASRTMSTHSHMHLHPEHMSTYHGLHGWVRHSFEHLGWMVLAKKYGYMDKVNCYKNSIVRLDHALTKSMKTIHEKDRKDDLAILHKDVCILKDFVHAQL